MLTLGERSNLRLRIWRLQVRALPGAPTREQNGEDARRDRMRPARRLACCWLNQSHEIDDPGHRPNRGPHDPLRVAQPTIEQASALRRADPDLKQRRQNCHAHIEREPTRRLRPHLSSLPSRMQRSPHNGGPPPPQSRGGAQREPCVRCAKGERQAPVPPPSFAPQETTFPSSTSWRFDPNACLPFRRRPVSLAQQTLAR